MVSEKVICIKDFYLNDKLLIKAGCDMFDSKPNWNIKKDIYRYIEFDYNTCSKLEIKEFWPKTIQEVHKNDTFTISKMENTIIEELEDKNIITEYLDLEIQNQETFDEHFVLIKEFKKHKQRIIDAGLYTEEIKKKTAINRNWKTKN